MNDYISVPSEEGQSINSSENSDLQDSVLDKSGDDILKISDDRPLLITDTPAEQIEYKTYKRRWYILIVYALLASTQNVFWLTFNTIGDHVNTILQINDKVANVISMLAPMWYVVIGLLVAWMVDNYGLRKPILAAAILMLLCCSGRLMMMGNSPWPLVVVMIAQSANAIAGPFLNATPAILSTTWFPPHQRSLATAVGFLSQNIGSAIAFLMGMLVNTDYNIWLLLYVEAGLGLAVALPVFFYFPERPPTPPSASAAAHVHNFSSPGLNFKEILKSICAYFKVIGRTLLNLPFISLLLMGGLSTGVSGGWMALLHNIISPLGFNPTQVMGLGVATTLTSIAGGIGAGLTSDYLPKRSKIILICLFFPAIGFFVWFLASIFEWIPKQYWMVIVSASCATTLISGTAPVIFEATLEVTHPAPETISGAILTMIMNACALFFMATKEFVDSKVINWIFFGTIILSAILSLVTPIKYNRINVDTGKALVEEIDQNEVEKQDIKIVVDEIIDSDIVDESTIVF